MTARSELLKPPDRDGAAGTREFTVLRYHAAVLRAWGAAGFVPSAPRQVTHLHMVLRMVASATLGEFIAAA